MITRVYERYQSIIKRDTVFWKGSFVGLLFITGVAFVGISQGMPTGIGLWFDIPVITLCALFLVWLASIGLAGLLTLLKVPLPRLFISGLICVYCTLSITCIQLNINYLGAAYISVGLITLGILLGSSIWLVKHKKGKRPLLFMYTSFSLILFIYSMIWLLGPGKAFHVAIQPQDSNYTPVLNTGISDPSLLGGYPIQAFTYGSGEDLLHDEFSSDVDYVTPTVDASGFLTEWHPLRSLYWGFDESDIPLEGRVWMPEGKGPFPLVLIVHGNSLMEKPSDEGYDYLGEHLASRGFIAVSVDQNFINFSVWSEGLDFDMTTRAWVLLQHLKMLDEASTSPNNPFYKKIDLNKIAIVGHSRGGQAAALAAVFKDFYNEDHYPEISLDYDFQIKAVAAIAPIDRKVDGRFVELHDVDYLVIQGAADSDVNTFYGDRQYRRTSFTQDSNGFKASLYIEGANHGHFNTVWGSQDTSMPINLLMNKKDILEGDEQRHIAKVYVTAFLEASLHGQREYLPILKDYRMALDWLPDTTYVNRFEDASFIEVTKFDVDFSRPFTGIAREAFTGSGFKAWEEKRIKNRIGQSTYNVAVKLEWNGRAEASYSIDLPEDYATTHQLDDTMSMVFSLANADIGRTSAYRQVPRIAIEMVTEDLTTVRLPLRQFRSYPPIIHSRYTKLGIFEQTVKQGNLGKSAEPVFQVYELPLQQFIAHHETFDPSKLSQIRFIFERGTAGKVWLDDIGFMKQFHD